MSEPTLVRCGCGGEVRFEPVENCLSDDDGLRAECSRCHVSTGVYFVTDYRGTPKEKAASAWNRAMSLDRLRDRYCIPPDMAVLDWLDQAAKAWWLDQAARAWEELAEQRTCLTTEAIVADLRRLAESELATAATYTDERAGQHEWAATVLARCADRYERGKLMTTEPKGESNA